MAKRYDSAPTLDYIKSRCEQVGDCWEWTGRMRAGVPWVYLPGVRDVPTRLAALNIAAGRPPDQRPAHGRYATTSCMNQACVNPEHAVLRTKKDMMRAWSKAGSYSDPAKAAKVAQTMRKRSKLSDAAVQEIRESDEPSKVLAERHGIHRHYVSALRSGLRRADTHSAASVFSWRP